MVVDNRKAGDLRCHRAHYDVIVMIWTDISLANMPVVHAVVSVCVCMYACICTL